VSDSSSVDKVRVGGPVSSIVHHDNLISQCTSK